MEARENNELIAEFMGFVKHQPTNPKYKYYYRKFDAEGLIVAEYHAKENGTFESLKYNSSWDWLMPVVEKINNTKHPTLDERIDVIIYRRTCHINDYEQIIIETTGKDMLECTYKAVVEFVKWYNSEKLNQEGIKEK